MTESPEEPEPGRRAEEEIEVVPATSTSHSLVFLDKFTQYRIQVCSTIRTNNVIYQNEVPYGRLGKDRDFTERPN